MADSRLENLKHTRVDLNGGGKVIVLDTGAVINAEAEAMLQALHSRSVGGLDAHLKVLAEKGPDNFMRSYYVGYNHKSIGDCGTTTIFIEGVSMLAAKAIQDSALYCGQEASTRYIDFSQQPMINPANTAEGKELLEMQRRAYLDARQPTESLLRQNHPKKEGEKEDVYDKAIKARTFDITRCLLPAGAATNLAWHTNLRQAADRVLFLRHHPLKEVQDLAHGLETALKEGHTNSFGHKRYESTEAYQKIVAAEYLFHDPNSPVNPHVNFRGIDLKEFERFKQLFEKRPEKTELPKYLAQIGTVSVRYQLDFGSFRDVQRHRAIAQRMPLLTSQLGFNQWYIDNLPQDISDKLPEHLQNINEGINALGISTEDAQYYLPMGYNTSNRFTGDLPATIYMVELRDSSLVHPTLQRVAHSIGNQIRSKLGIQLYTDPDPGRFNIKRGLNDITPRPA